MGSLHGRRILISIAATVLLLLGSSCFWAFRHGLGQPICREAPYSPPPAAFEDEDLVGTWEATYGRSSIDSLTFRHDGTFKQIYADPSESNYRYETQWNLWWVERGPDGLVRVHLEGARYYVAGIDIAEREGVEPQPYPGFWSGSGPPPSPFYDPFAEDHLFMLGELILAVRVDSSQELLLHHLWTHHDRGFPLYGCQHEHFRRVDSD
jgi:hypothetical protein